MTWSGRGISAYSSFGFMFRLEHEEATLMNQYILNGLRDILQQREVKRRGTIYLTPIDGIPPHATLRFVFADASYSENRVLRHR